MAPEAFETDENDKPKYPFDTKAEVWALGVVSFEIANLKLPVKDFTSLLIYLLE